MFDVAGDLMSALQNARERLGSAAAQTARAQTPYGSARTDSAMAAVAESAVFTEALLGAVHARLAEIKAVAHG